MKNIFGHAGYPEFASQLTARPLLAATRRVVMAAALVAVFAALDVSRIAPLQSAPAAATPAAAETVPTPKLAAFLPADVDRYAEVTDVAHLTAAVRNIEFLKDIPIDWVGGRKFLLQCVQQGVGVDESAGTKIMDGVQSFGWAWRIAANDKPAAKCSEKKIQQVAVIKFRDAACGESMFSGTRFSLAGVMGPSGKLYHVEFDKRKEGEESENIIAEQLRMIEKGDAGSIAVWFPSQAVAAIGSKDLLLGMADVIDGKSPSLAKDPSFHVVRKNLAPGAHLIDIGHIADLSIFVCVAGLFDHAPFLETDWDSPAAYSAKVVPEGFTMKVCVPLDQKVMSPNVRIPDATPLALVEKLPASTIGCVAFGGKMTLSGTEYMKAVYDWCGKMDGMFSSKLAAQCKTADEELKQATGLELKDLLDALGDEVVFGGAIAGDATEWLANLDEKGPGESLNKAGITLLVKLRNQAPVKTLLALAQAGLESTGQAVVLADGGFTCQKVFSDEQVAEFKIAIVDGILFAAFGGKDAVAESWNAFNGKSKQLGGETVYRIARARVEPQAHILCWLDTGRMLQIMRSSNTVTKLATSKETLGSAEALGRACAEALITGDKRFTSSMSCRLRRDSSGHTVVIEDSNGVLIVCCGLFAGAAEFRKILAENLNEKNSK